MRRIVRTVLCVLVVLSVFVGLGGCAQNKARTGQTSDPIIQDYMRERSNLMAQRRKLASTYGADSPTVAQADGQIRLVDEAVATRRQQLMEQESAHQELQRMKNADQ